MRMAAFGTCLEPDTSHAYACVHAGCKNLCQILLSAVLARDTTRSMLRTLLTMKLMSLTGYVALMYLCWKFTVTVTIFEFGTINPLQENNYSM